MRMNNKTLGPELQRAIDSSPAVCTQQRFRAMNTKRRRASTRRPLFCAAWIEEHGGVRRCTLSEIAEGGAKIRLETRKPVPNRFVLRLSADGSVRRKCRVVRRTGQNVEITFDTPLDEQTVLLAANETNWTVE